MAVRRIHVVAIAVAVAAIVAIVVWPRGEDDAQRTDDAVARTRVDPLAAAARSSHRRSGTQIAGVVLGEDGAPLGGAAVRLGGGATEPAVTTDASGRFDFGVQPRSRYVVVADKPGLTGALVQIDTRAIAADQLRLVLHVCDAAIHGTVRDGAGGVIAGARVSLASAALTTSSGAESDARGDYELCVPVGGADVVVTADGYGRLGETIRAFGRMRRDFTLAPGTTVTGQVVRAGDRSAVAGATVELVHADRSVGVTVHTVIADADGKFEFDGVAPGQARVTAAADDGVTARPVEIATEVGKPTRDVVCELAAAYTVSGRVVERGANTPIDGARIYLHGEAQGSPHLVVTPADGTFAITRVLPGQYMLGFARPRKPGDAPRSVKVEAADVTGVVLEDERPATISGRIVLAGKPIDGARVELRGGNVSSAAVSAYDGRYTLADVVPGTYAIYAESTRVGAFTNGTTVTVAAGERKTGVDLELDLAGSIAGTVVDQNDAPVAGAFLAFSLLHGRDFGSATTADDGTFKVGALSGGGDYVFEVRDRDGSVFTYPPVAGKRFAPVAVAGSSSHVTGVRVQIRVERLVIAGRVIDASGKGVADALVNAMPTERGGGYRVPTASTNEQGAFTLRDLRPGAYRIGATGASGDVVEDNVTAGRTDLVLRMAEPGGIDGVVEGFAPDIGIVAVRANPPGQYHTTATAGAFALRKLTPGDYRIYAQLAQGSHPPVTAVVTAGAITKVTLRKPDVGTIAVRLTDDTTRAPIAQVRCTCGYQAAMTDARGEVRFEGVAVGANLVICFAAAKHASGQITVVRGQVATLELVAMTRTDDDRPKRGHAGLTLEDQLETVMVGSVEPNGPAARAGIAVGDVIVSIDGYEVTRWSSDAVLTAIEGHVDPAKLTLERGDKQLTVLVTVAR